MITAVVVIEGYPNGVHRPPAYRETRIQGRSLDAIARARFGQDVSVRDGRVWARKGAGALHPIAEIWEAEA